MDLKRLERCIDLYLKRGLANIDLLVLSHLHTDHVNGIPYLLGKTRVDTAILPYLHPIERLLIAALQPPMPPWYYLFLASPAAFLISMGVRNIYFLGGGEGPGFGEERPPPEGPPSPEEKLPEELKFKLKWHQTTKGEPEEVHPEDRAHCQELAEKWNANIQFRKTEGFTTYEHEYVSHLALVFFVKPIEQKWLNGFSRCLKERGVIKDVDEISTQVLLEVLLNKRKLKTLKTCYKKNMSKDLNLTSLSLGVTTAWTMLGGIAILQVIGRSTGCLMVRLIERHWPYVVVLGNRAYYQWWLGDTHVLPFCVLLTGDTRLDLTSVRKPFMNRYGTIFRRYLARDGPYALSVFQAPHHGSIRGFDVNTMNEFLREKFLFSTSVVSCKWPPRGTHALNLLRNISSELIICHQESGPVNINMSSFGLS